MTQEPAIQYGQWSAEWTSSRQYTQYYWFNVHVGKQRQK